LGGVGAGLARAPRIAPTGGGGLDRERDGGDTATAPPAGRTRGVERMRGVERGGRLRPLATASVRALALVGLLWGYSMWLFVSWFPTYLADAWGLTMAELGWVNSVPTLGGIAAMLAGGVISDRLVRS